MQISQTNPFCLIHKQIFGIVMYLMFCIRSMLQSSNIEVVKLSIVGLLLLFSLVIRLKIWCPRLGAMYCNTFWFIVFPSRWFNSTCHLQCSLKSGNFLHNMSAKPLLIAQSLETVCIIAILLLKIDSSSWLK